MRYGRGYEEEGKEMGRFKRTAVIPRAAPRIKRSVFGTRANFQPNRTQTAKGIRDRHGKDGYYLSIR